MLQVFMFLGVLFSSSLVSVVGVESSEGSEVADSLVLLGKRYSDFVVEIESYDKRARVCRCYSVLSDAVVRDCFLSNEFIYDPFLRISGSGGVVILENEASILKLVVAESARMHSLEFLSLMQEVFECVVDPNQVKFCYDGSERFCGFVQDAISRLDTE